MDENNRNLLLAVLLSALVLFGWEYFVIGPQTKLEQQKQALLAQQEKTHARPEMTAPGVPNAGTMGTVLSRAAALKLGGQRVAIDTPTVDGSLLLKGARFDDLRLKKYHETVDPKSPEIVLLAPKDTAFPYYAQFGWVAAAGKSIRLPNESTPWKVVSGTVVAPGKDVVLEWDNGQGLVFTRDIGVDDKYMFTVKDSVKETAAGAHATLYPYAYVARDGVPKSQHFWALHEGFVGTADGALKDATYDDFKDDSKPPQTFSTASGWLGITDKYWMAAVIPPQGQTFDAAFRASRLDANTKAYQADYRLGAMSVGGGGVTVTHRLFAGAKVVDILRYYQHHAGVPGFDYAVDWGWFWFFTRPLFWLIDQLNHYLGNFGLAILLATVVLRLALFPLANASMKSMTKMKKVQPEMQRIQERFADDKVRQQQEIMDLYKREKVNPLAGCVPLLIQIPIMFSLYKVFIVTIEMYHAPFFGWIRDLSAPDPTSILNLFGLLPYSIPAFVPAFLSIGVWPILMGATQWIQTKMNPAPADPVQARMFTYMPVFMAAMFATLPAGLIIYYTWNNILSVTQQYVIMRGQGVPVHLVENMKPPAAVQRLVSRVRQRIGLEKAPAGE